MTVVDRTPASQSDRICFEFELRHPPEKVWRALTDPVLLSEWLMPVVDQKLALEQGKSFVLKIQPRPGWEGFVNCRMLEIDAPRKLSYAWVVENLELDTVVTFTLTRTASGTRMLLEQSGFKPHQKQNRSGARYGFKMMGERLVALLGRIS